MAKILNNVGVINKEYSQTKYKYETEIKEYQKEIEIEKNKKLKGWKIEKKDYSNTFNKKHEWILIFLFSLHLLLFIFYLVYAHYYFLPTAFYSKIFTIGIVSIVCFIFECFIFGIIKYFFTKEYIKRLNLIIDNKIKSYEEHIEVLKKYYIETLNSKKFEKKAKYLVNHGKICFANYIKTNFQDNVYLLNDFCSTINKKTLQIDHIMISPKGIFCVEIKSANKIFYPLTTDKWMYYSVDTECEIDNPQKSIMQKVELLEEKLGNLYLQIIPVVVLTHPDSGFIGESLLSCKIVHLDEITDYYNEKKELFSEEQVESIAKMIFDLHNKK
jgi:hypothetical protein